MIKAILALVLSGQVIGKTLNVPLNGLPSDFDPQTMSDIYSMIANLQLHRGLLKFNSLLEVENDFAKSFEVLDNGKKIIFHLRDDIHFSDGSKIKAIDVVKTFKRMFKIKSAMASDLSYIDDISEISDNSVLFKLKSPSSLFFKQLSTVDCAILKLTDNLELVKHVYSGPYRLESLNNDFIILQIIEDKKYKNAPKKIKFILKDDKKISFKFIKDNYDTVDGLILSKDISDSLKKSGWNESVSTTANIFALILNPNKIQHEDRSRIFNYFYYDKSFITDKNFIPMTGVVPAAISGPVYSFILDKKEISLRKSNLALEMIVVKDMAGLNMIQKSLMELKIRTGIEIKIKELAVTDFINKVKNDDFELRVLPKLVDYPDPYAMLAYFRSGYEANKYFINDTEIDKLLDKSISELNKEKRYKIYHEIQQIILNKKIFVPLFSGTSQEKLWSSKVKFVPSHPMGLISLPFEEIKVE
ncbi:MAG: ABC transporter substrate-binding protein [Pseudobdellovibrio sp.]